MLHLSYILFSKYFQGNTKKKNIFSIKKNEHLDSLYKANHSTYILKISRKYDNYYFYYYYFTFLRTIPQHFEK